jgi:SAM-dependent methyltransferase
MTSPDGSENSGDDWNGEYRLLAEGYGVSGYEEPMWGHSPDRETWHLRDRDFSTIDECFNPSISACVESRLNQWRRPICVLDVGGGALSVAAQGLAEKYPGLVEVTNLDPILRAGTDKNDNVHAISGDVAEMKFPDGSFDVVYSYQVFHRLDPRRQILGLGEIARILKPGGTALIDEDIFSSLSSNDPDLIQAEKVFSLRLSSSQFARPRRDNFLLMEKP